MHFRSDESAEIALEVIRAVVSRQFEVEAALSLPPLDAEATREQLLDRLTGLRYVFETTREQLVAMLRITVEND